MNKTESGRYGYLPDYIETQSLSSEIFKISFNFYCIKKSKQVSNRLSKSNKMFYSNKKKKLRENLNIGENVLLLAKRIKRCQPWENFTNAQFKKFLF